MAISKLGRKLMDGIVSDFVGKEKVTGGFFYKEALAKINMEEIPTHIMEEEKPKMSINRVVTVGGQEVDNSNCVPLIKKGVWVGWQTL